MIPALMIILGLLILAFLLILSHPLFGRAPSGRELERIHASPNYKDQAFQNIERTPLLSEGFSVWEGIKHMLFETDKNAQPKTPIPCLPLRLEELNTRDNILVWLGHSSYFLQLEGLRILVDPVFSKHASPMPGSVRAFRGTENIKCADIPDLDYIFITHDHYDHLDYASMRALRNRTDRVIAPLGVAGHLSRWGYTDQQISELDWNESLSLKNGLNLTSVPARHGSGRGFRRNQSLWTAYVLSSPNLKLFLGGDSGYGQHFKTIGQQHGPFDLAILENGQYNERWRYIHMFPEEVLQATRDLQAKALLPVHSGKFKLSTHAWNTPLRTLFQLNEKNPLPLMTPKIGEPVNLQDQNRSFEKWYD